MCTATPMPTGKFSGEYGTCNNEIDNTIHSLPAVCLSYTANPNICTVHLINDGVTVNGNTATVEFASSGPTTTFQCSLDGQGFSACELVCVRVTDMQHQVP